MSWKHFINVLASVVYVGLYLYTGANKLLQFAYFEQSIESQPLPAPVIAAVKWTLPVVLLVVPVLILIPKTYKWGLRAATSLMFVFTVYVTLAWMGAFDNQPCTCAGISASISMGEHVVIDSIALLLGTLAILFEDKKMPAPVEKLRGDGKIFVH